MILQCPITYERFAFGSLSNFQEPSTPFLHPILQMPQRSFLGTAFMPRNLPKFAPSEQRSIWLAALHRTQLVSITANPLPSEQLVSSSYWRIHAALVYLNQQLPSIPNLPTYNIDANNQDCASLVTGWLPIIENYVSVGRVAYQRSALDLGASVLERRFDLQLSRNSLKPNSKLFSPAMLDFCVSQLAIKRADDRAHYRELLSADPVDAARISKNPYMDYLDLLDYVIDWSSNSNLRLRVLALVRNKLSILDEFGLRPLGAKLEANAIALAELEDYDDNGDPIVLSDNKASKSKAITFSLTTLTAKPPTAPSPANRPVRSDYATLSEYIQALKAAAQ